jgi:hypothetical protein
VRSPTLATIAERGPEAVIPLTRSDRSRGLLSAAAGAIGKGPLGPGAAGGAGSITGSTLNFAPVITVEGGATPQALGAMQENLRKLADEFLRRFNQAQEQQRRLAFS